MKAVPMVLALALFSFPPLDGQVRTTTGLGAAAAVGALFLAAATPDSADAQDSTIRGQWSIALAFPFDGGGLLGLWRRLSRHVNVGLNVGISTSAGEQSSQLTGAPTASRTDQRTLTLHVEPTARFYLTQARSVVPFVLLRGGVSFSDSDASGATGNSELESRNWSFGVGIGAEWFPVDIVSLSAWTGLSLARSTFMQLSDSGRTSRATTAFSTSTSVLTFQLYF